jgi:wyosine [tRNA(Phe)-imidazoG37] synthetase (radical SAM superfamily)
VKADRSREKGTLRKIGLQESFIYGPVASRRLGKSLGVNPILPGRKACSFNCVYCQYEAVRPVRSLRDVDPGVFGNPAAIERELRDRLEKLREREDTVSYITFAGNGEPTLHPAFPELVERVLSVRADLHPAARTAILTNGTTLVLPEVKEAVKRLDTAIVKLDAGSPEGILRVNRPYKGYDLDLFLEAAMGLSHLVIQTLFFDGLRSNAREEDIVAWIRALARLMPGDVQVYSLDRAPAEEGITPLSRQRLEEIVARLLAETGLRAVVY